MVERLVLSRQATSFAPSVSYRHTARVRSHRRLSIVARMSQEDDVSVSPPPPSKSRGFISKLGQSFNGAGIVLFGKVALADRQLAIPHLTINDLRSVNWAVLKAAGFEGCVFDKDNTLTEPYAMEIHPTAKESLQECSREFDGRVVLYSNSAGLEQFDPEGKEANELETALGIPVLRHKEKKPAGGPEDLETHFGCRCDKLIMVGDRYLTDIVFGNRLGMFTIRPQPFTSQGEPKAVRLARAVEEAFVRRCEKAGVEPVVHPLLKEGTKHCIR